MPAFALSYVFLLLASPAHAQEPSRVDLLSVVDLPVVDIQVDAPPGVPLGIAHRAIPIRIGEPFDMVKVRAAIKRLFQLGLFENVAVRVALFADGLELRFVLVPERRLAALEVEGAAEHATALADASGLRLGAPFTPEQLTGGVARMRAYLRDRGYWEAAVAAEAYDAGEGPALRFLVTLGQPVTVASLAFGAGERLPRADLEAHAPLEVGDALDRAVLEDAPKILRDRLRALGFLEVEVRRAEVSVDLTNRTAAVRFPLVLGHRVEIVVTGNVAISDAVLLEEFALGERPFSRAVAEDLAGDVERSYRRLGYLDAAVHVVVFRDDLGGRKRVELQVEEGRLVTVHALRFEVTAPDTSARASARWGDTALADEALREVVEAALGTVLEQRLSRQLLDRDDVEALTTSRPRRGDGVTYRPRGLLYVAAPEEIFEPEAYEEAVEDIERRYLAEGHLAVRVAPARLERVSPDQGDVVIAIDEGERTFVEVMSFSGNQALAGADLLAATTIHAGDPLNAAQIEESRLALLDVYGAHGFHFAQVLDRVEYGKDDPDRVEKCRQPSLGCLTVRFVVEEGPQVRVSEILVRGNDLTRASTVLDLVAVQPGELYRPEDVSESQRRLAATGLFSRVKLRLLDEDVAEPVKDVIVDVSERSPRDAEVRLGWSTEDGIRLSGGFRHHNVFGRGWQLDTGLRLSALPPPGDLLDAQLVFYDDTLASTLRRRYDPEAAGGETVFDLEEKIERLAHVGLRLPSVPVPFLPFDAIRLDLTHTRDNTIPYSITSFAFILGGERALGDDLVLVLQNRSAVNLLQCFPGVAIENRGDTEITSNCTSSKAGGTTEPTGEATAPAVDQNPLDERLNFFQNGFGPRLSLDLRDNPFSPRKGLFASAGVEHITAVALDPDTTLNVNLVKVDTELVGYVPLSRDVTLSLRGQIGNLVFLGGSNEVPPNEAFFMGGRGSLRAFAEKAALPADLCAPKEKGLRPCELYLANDFDPENQVVVGRGGHFFMLMQGELRLPTYVVDGLKIGLFVDVGNLWMDPANVRFSTLAVNIGAGLRYSVPPVGTLRFDLGFNLTPRDDLSESLSESHIAIGDF